MLFRKILLASLLVGLVSGVALGLIQQFTTTPIIIAAEAYEVTDPAATTGHSHDHGDGWAPQDGIERTLYSIGATVIIACAYALLLMSVMALSGRANLRNGLIWGLAGYAVFFLAPSLGLAPEIPGTQTAALEGRQGWWLATVCMTAAGIGFLFFARKYYKLIAVPLLLIPHVLGAPHPEQAGFANTHPDAIAALTSLEHEFFIATAVTLAIFWVLMGVLSAYASERYINTDTSAA